MVTLAQPPRLTGVICVDDNIMVASALEGVVRASPDLRWDGSSADPAAVLSIVLLHLPAVVLMDLEIAGVDICALIAQLTRSAPQTRVLMLSATQDSEAVSRCLHAGAWGFVCKDHVPAYILDAVRRVAAGEFVLCDEIAGLPTAIA